MIHQYKLNGHNIVIDVYSGSVHLVDDLVYDLLPLIEKGYDEKTILSFDDLNQKYNNLDIETALSEINELIDQDLLFSEDDYPDHLKKGEIAPIKALCLHIAHDCNLRCEYCFASKGDFGQGRKLMDTEVGFKAIDFVIERSEGRKNIEIDFFGGEPLMNFETVKEIVTYARSKENEFHKKFRFTITTNGLLLDDKKIDFINKEMSNVVLSLDGREVTNDQMRKKVDGRGSYHTIVPKFLSLVQKRNFENYYVRGTFTKYNLDFCEDVLHLNELGFDQISVEPAVGDSDTAYAITSEDLPVVFKEYEKLANLLIQKKKEGNGFNFFHFMIDLEQGPCAIKRLRGCGCGNEYAAITPDGDVYPCHQFVGKEEWKLGSIFEGKLDEESRKKFALANIYTKDDCKNCWAKFYCSGGCSANNSQMEGSILKPSPVACELERKRIECAIMIKASMAEND